MFRIIIALAVALVAVEQAPAQCNCRARSRGLVIEVWRGERPGRVPYDAGGWVPQYPGSYNTAFADQAYGWSHQEPRRAPQVFVEVINDCQPRQLYEPRQLGEYPGSYVPRGYPVPERAKVCPNGLCPLR